MRITVRDSMSMTLDTVPDGTLFVFANDFRVTRTPNVYMCKSHYVSRGLGMVNVVEVGRINSAKDITPVRCPSASVAVIDLWEVYPIIEECIFGGDDAQKAN